MFDCSPPSRTWLLSDQESIIHLSDSTAAVRFIITFILIFTLLAIYPAKMYLSTRSVLTGSISVFVCICKAQHSECPEIECQDGRFTKPKRNRIPNWTSDLSLIVSPASSKNKLDLIWTVYTLFPTWKIGLELQILN